MVKSTMLKCRTGGIRDMSRHYLTEDEAFCCKEIVEANELIRAEGNSQRSVVVDVD